MGNTKYTKEFKESTVQLVMNSGKTVSQIGADLDVNPKTIYNWVKVYKEANNVSVEGDKTSKIMSVSTVRETVNDELKRLRAENKSLKQERDILKKATAYFAKGIL